MAIVNLGSIKFNWRGAYDGATSYTIDDVVSSGGNSYVCIAATTGNTPPNATYWELMAQAGTNGTDGTDLTTTLTTQGDIVYRDASGLQRLGAGTSGQVLQTGGTGANPSWGTVSSDYVKLASGTISTPIASLDLDVISSTYKFYEFRYSHISPATTGELRYQWKDSSGVISNSNYVWTLVRPSRTSGSQGLGNDGGWNDTKVPMQQTLVDNDFGLTGVMTFGNVNDSSIHKFSNNVSSWYNAGEFYHNTIGGWLNLGSKTVTGISFTFNSGNIDGGDYALYGIKS